MTYLNRVRIALGALLLLAAVLAGIGIFQIFENRQMQVRFDAIMATERQALDQLDTLVTLNAQIGYTRFIHNFKNGVLRRLPAKLDQAAEDLDAADRTLDALVAGDPGLAEPAAVIRATLRDYRAMVPVARQMIDDGAEAVAIDLRVKVDDGPAIAALATMQTYLQDRRERLFTLLEQLSRDQRFDRIQFTVMSVLAILIACLIAVLAQIARRRTRALSATVDTIDAISADLAARMRHRNGLDWADSPTLLEDGASGDDTLLAGLRASLATLMARLRAQRRELSERAEALALINEDLSRFAFVASHDLQEPLRKIEMNIDLIKTRDGADLPARAAERLVRIEHAAGGMRRLIEDLLAFSRAGTRDLAESSCPVGDLVSAALEATEEQFREKGGDGTSAIDAGLAVAGDRTMLVQAFANILSNAAKYARNDVPPHVDVTATRQGGEIVIRFADNGIGFEPEFAEQIFEPFRRLHGKSEYPGSGIGLSIVRRVVQRHGGHVAATSTPGAGATFTVTLPAGDAQAAASKESDGS
ncbi:MAG: ATP-binding protein [Pseudomonadota bacterium]|nr:ATP-binding protein [Pseudomonadota bacterium]